MAKKFTELADSKTPKYFYLLDIVRGFAALAVVLWHWQHFYVTKDGFLPGFHTNTQPFYSVFFPFYNYGLIAVDLFFLISGFVFFYLYSKSIADKKINGKSFSILRFSRLYPLHFLTLLLVLLLQSFFYHHAGYYFVYPENDLYHFILNIFFASSWGLEHGPSFNGPNWSVSVEILLYGLFFVVCRFRFKKYLMVFLILSGLVIQTFYAPIGHGVYSFFLGGMLYYFYLHIVKINKQKRWLNLLRILSVLFILLILLDSKYSFLENFATKTLQAHHVHFDIAFALQRIDNLLVRTFIFPVFLLYIVLLETVKGARGKMFSFVGHISYSSYLLHFPLQLIIILCCSNVDRVAFFNSAYIFFLFFSVLITISLLSYNYFELPLQKYLRSRLIGNKQ